MTHCKHLTHQATSLTTTSPSMASVGEANNGPRFFFDPPLQRLGEGLGDALLVGPQTLSGLSPRTAAGFGTSLAFYFGCFNFRFDR